MQASIHVDNGKKTDHTIGMNAKTEDFPSWVGQEEVYCTGGKKLLELVFGTVGPQWTFSAPGKALST